MNPWAGSALTLVFGAVILVQNFLNFRIPVMVLGIINWKLEQTSFFIFSALIVAVTVPLTIEFMLYGLKNRELFWRCLFLALTFCFIAAGSIITLSDMSFGALAFGHTLMSLGFVAGAFAVILYKRGKIKE